MSHPIPGVERFSGGWICYWLILKKGMSHFKDTEEGVIKVCDKLEMYASKRKEEGRAEGLREGKTEGIKEGKTEGIKEGKTEGIKEGSAVAKRENAKRMIASGKLTLEDVSLFSDLPLSDVIELANKKAD